jgi:hypothetical protein
VVQGHSYQAFGLHVGKVGGDKSQFHDGFILQKFI